MKFANVCYFSTTFGALKVCLAEDKLFSKHLMSDGPRTSAVQDNIQSCDACAANTFTTCDGNCLTCGFGSAWTSATDCIACKDGYELDVIYSDCTGSCVPTGTASNPVHTNACAMPCAQCGSNYHDWNDASTCAATCTEAGNAKTSGCFAGDGTSNACASCGYGGATGAADCITCFGTDEIEVVYSDCTGRCVPAGTSTAPMASDACKMSCASCGNDYDGFVKNDGDDDDDFCFHVDTKVDYKGVEYTYEELKAGKEPECTVPHSPSSKGVVISTSCDKTVRVTDTHLMATTKGFQLAYSLKPGDVLFGDYHKDMCTVKSVEKEKATQQYFGLNCVHSEVLASGLRASTFGDFHTLPSWYMTYVGGLVGSETASALGEYIAEWYFQKK